jgi:hypothetical protein
MTAPVQIPADVDREDRLLGDLTARQLIILGTAALAVYLVWIVTGPDRALLFGLLAAPVSLAGVVLAFGRRDGVSADRLLWAALTQRRQTPTASRPQRTRAATANGPSAPDTDPCVTSAPRRRRVRTRGDGRTVAAHVPARRVLAPSPDLGVLDLGRDGWAVVCAVTPVNFTLRSGPERDALQAGFSRWLHSLAYPVQILTRTHPVDLSATITGLRRDAARLPHPALRAAAHAHAEHLQALGDAAELLHREFLIVFRSPHPPAPPRARRGTRALPRHETAAGELAAGQIAAGQIAAEQIAAEQIAAEQIASGEIGADRAGRAAASQLRHRAEDAVRLLGAIGLRVTPLDPAEAARVLIAATRPDTAMRLSTAEPITAAPITAAPITAAPITAAPITAAAVVESAGGRPSTPRPPRRPFVTPPHATRPHSQPTPTRPASARPASMRPAGPCFTAPGVEASPMPNPAAPSTAWSPDKAAHRRGLAVHDAPTIDLNLRAPTPGAAPASRAGLTSARDDRDDDVDIELANTAATAADASLPLAGPDTVAAMAAAITAALEPGPASGDHATAPDTTTTQAATRAEDGALVRVAEDMTLAGDEELDSDLDLDLEGDLAGGGASPETGAALVEPGRPVAGQAVRPAGSSGGGSGRRRGSPGRAAPDSPGARVRRTPSHDTTGDRR